MAPDYRPSSPLPLPVRMYQTDDHLIVAAPMPGLEPEDIAIVIRADPLRLRLQGDERGPRQHELDLLLAEWFIGPYFREVDLPYPVNGPLSNATYGNGVLVVSMPRLKPGEPKVTVEYRLVSNRSAQGERVGHSGRTLEPTTTKEHRQKVTEAVRQPPHHPAGG